MPDIPWEDAFVECLSGYFPAKRHHVCKVLPLIPLAELQAAVGQAFAPISVHLNELTVVLKIYNYCLKLDSDLVSYRWQVQFANDVSYAATHTKQAPYRFSLDPAWFTREGCFLLLTNLQNHWTKATNIPATFPDIWTLIANYTPKTDSEVQTEVRNGNASPQDETPNDQIGSGDKNCFTPTNPTYMVFVHGYQGGPCLISASSAADIEDKIIEILTTLASADKLGYQLVVLEGEYKLVQITKMMSVSEKIRDNDSLSNFYFMIAYVSELNNCTTKNVDYREFIREKMFITQISQTPISIDNL